MDIKMQIFTFLFLMLGPFKIVGPFAKITQGADPVLTRKLAVTAIIYSSIALLLAGFLGQSIMSKYGIPLPILGLSGGIILFLVALLNIIHQFTPGSDKEDKVTAPTMNMAMHPLAFPTIVTPYGIAAVIIFLAMFPDLRLYIGIVVLAMMALNLIIMLITRYIYKVLAVILALLGAILGIVQVALGLMIIYNQLNNLLKM